MKSAVMMLLLLVGCQQECPIPVVEADEPELRETLQDLVEHFYDGMAAPICVRSFKAKPFRESVKHLGTYSRSTKKIEVDSNTLSSNLVTWHELCHAADHQLQIDSHKNPYVWPPRDSGPREQFAVACSIGPTSAAWAGMDCAEDSPLAQATGQELMRVFKPLPQAEIEPIQLKYVASSDVQLDPDAKVSYVLPLADTTSGIAIDVIGPDGRSTILRADLWTGEPATGDRLWEELDVKAVPPVPPFWEANERSHFPATLAKLRLENGATFYRSVMRNSGKPFCAVEGQKVVSVYDQLFAFRNEGGVISWYNLTER